jgi:putative MFS transporter
LENSEAHAAPGLQAAVGERLDHLKSFKVGYWTPLLLGAMMMGDSWDIAVVGYSMPALRHEWHLTALQVGAILSCGFAGQLLGALSFGSLAERFGRLRVLVCAVVMMSILSLICSAVSDPFLFAALRFVQGIGFGGAAPVCATYIHELAPTISRGRYFLTYQFLVVAGFSLCAGVSSYVIPTFGWRPMFVLAAFPVLLCPLVILTLPESPRWLASLGRLGATNRALAKLGAKPLADDIDLSVRVAVSSIPIRELFTAGLARFTLLTCLLWFCTAMVSNAFSAWGATILVDVFKLTVKESLRVGALAGVGYGLSPLLFALIIDRTGRRPVGIAGAIITLGTTLTLTLLGLSQPSLSVGLIGLGWITSGASFIILWPYTGEVFPTRVRSTALGLCSAVARIGSMVTPLIVAGVLSSTGTVSAVFAVLTLGTAIVLAIWIYATKEMARLPLDQPSVAIS